MANTPKRRPDPPTLESILRNSLKADAYVTTLVEASKDTLTMSLWWDVSKEVYEFEVDKNEVCYLKKFERQD